MMKLKNIFMLAAFVFRAFGKDGRKGDAFCSDFVKDRLHEAVTTEQQLQSGLSNL